MIKNLISILFILISFQGVSQIVKVFDEHTLKPVSGVLIYSNTDTISSETDKKGNADVSGFKNESVLILVHDSYLEYRISKHEILTQSNKVYLTESSIKLDPYHFQVARNNSYGDTQSGKTVKTSHKEIAKNNPQTTADALGQTGQVLIQKSQAGGGSPIIRGFEANKVLLVIDGIRMNNAIYRSGHLQNSITIDPNILESIDINYGPSSVIYGSDALGGVIHFHTRQPKFNEDTLKLITNSGSAYTRFSSANMEKTFHVDMMQSGKNWGGITSITISDVGDLKIGENRSGDPEWGKVYFFTDHVEGSDVMVVNDNPNIHKKTAYSQYDFLHKSMFSLTTNSFLTFNLQYSTTSNINRNDKLSEYKGSELRFAEWYYGPQDRFLASIAYKSSKKTKLYNSINIIGAYQFIEEDRINRKLNSLSRSHRMEDVHVYSLNADFSKRINYTSKIFYGIESTYNRVNSDAFSEDITTGIKGVESTRYPDGGSDVLSNGLYLTYSKEFAKVTFHGGLRYNLYQAQSQFIDTTIYNLPFQKVNFTNGALSGSTGATYTPGNSWKFNVTLSTGYRNPNVDDYGKVFEKNGFVVVPNNNLKPEYAYNGEIGISKGLFKDSLIITTSAYYTLLENAIVRRNSQLNDSDSMLYEGEMARIQHNTNASSAYIYGFSGSIIYGITSNLKLFSSINFTVGRDQTENIPLAHIAPVFGKGGLTFYNSKLQLNLFTEFNAIKKLEDADPGTTDNIALATDMGWPAWATLNLSSSYSFNKVFTGQFGIDNIFDTHYRRFASGISSPGRNYRITLRANF